MSPRKKRPKLSPNNKKSLKRENGPDETSRKRAKAVKNADVELQTKKKKNFIQACRQVSCSAYFDHRARLLLLYLPSCTKTSVCKHHDKNGKEIKQMPSYAQESFSIEIKSKIWYEALEVCQFCITPVQYLSANVLKDVVEIILNAHEDEYADYSVSQIINKSQQILALNFSTHPPCLVKDLRTCYIDFLTSPMELKEDTFTNRAEFEHRKGIVKYCMNRVEYEMSASSQDGPLVDKEENTPEDMKQSLRGTHFQKEKFEIFELLDRPNRIERLFIVLESVVELLQFDLAIWLLRHSNNITRHIMRSTKPLMAVVLWSDNVLYTGAVTANSRQIMRIFAHVIHLQYPDSMQRTMIIWLNTMVQTYYLCESYANVDYPNTAKFCNTFANEFYKLISGMPHDSIVRILEKIEPTFMRHMMGMLHIKKLLGINSDCIISILIKFFKESQWQNYPPEDSEIKICPKLFEKPKKVKKTIQFLLKQCEKWSLEDEPEEKIVQYDKLDNKALKPETECSLNNVVHTLFITLEAYLDTYNVQDVQETWNKLNENPEDGENKSQTLLEQGYVVTEDFIKKYKHIMKTSQELRIVYHNLSNSGDMPDILEVFKTISLLEP
ncbi:uncharacterized protein LOC110374818 [Helicoverpa armigera]|uniref:uncharacterized protein LOC110374818 n=1 Tax=Helicoverpa armigera TaxID=29058 RepID=UPI0030831F63